MNNKSKAFTLIEMTVAICVIAVLCAATVPNITKKLHTKAKANANQLTTDCDHFNFKSSITGTEVSYNGYCKSCYEHKCVSCKLDYLDGYVILQDTCTYKACSELHGSSCKYMCSELECLDGIATEDWDYNYQTQNNGTGLTGIQ